MMRLARRASLTVALLVASSVNLIGGGRVFGQAPTREQAVQLCINENAACISGFTFSRVNPHISSFSCDIDRTNGTIDVSTWKKCRDWCEENRKQCLRDVERLFRK